MSIGSLATAAGVLGALLGSFVEVSSTTFTDPAAVPGGTFVVRPLDGEQANSLQFRTVAATVSAQLQQKGFSPAGPEEAPRLIVYVTYGIDDGRSRVVSLPTWGQTGGGTTFTSGTVSGRAGQFGAYNATSTTMPTYGVTGSQTFSQTTYRRAFNLDIYDAQGPTPTKVVEVRAVSVGSCGNINSVINEIARGALEKYPGQSGKTQRAKIPWSGKC